MTMPHRIFLPARVRGALADACLTRLPNEACGVIFGRTHDFTTEAEGFAVVRNTARRPAEAFSFDPDDWVSTFCEAQRNRRSIVGLFHSHPEGSPIPSAEDTLGWLPWGTYWIVAIRDESCEIAVYTRDENQGWCQCLLK